MSWHLATSEASFYAHKAREVRPMKRTNALVLAALMSLAFISSTNVSAEARYWDNGLRSGYYVNTHPVVINNDWRLRDHWYANNNWNRGHHYGWRNNWHNRYYGTRWHNRWF
jgi:hypothetical protein